MAQGRRNKAASMGRAESLNGVRGTFGETQALVPTKVAPTLFFGRHGVFSDSLSLEWLPRRTRLHLVVQGFIRRIASNSGNPG